MADQLVWFENLSHTDVAIAGGKGANLGEAVRSSAPSEDTASTSFAGMHETFTHVVGEVEVIAKSGVMFTGRPTNAKEGARI